MDEVEPVVLGRHCFFGTITVYVAVIDCPLTGAATPVTFSSLPSGPVTV